MKKKKKLTPPKNKNALLKSHLEFKASSSVRPLVLQIQH